MTEYPPGYPPSGHPPSYPPPGQPGYPAPPPYGTAPYQPSPGQPGYPAPPPYGTYEDAPYGQWQYPPATGRYPYVPPPSPRRLDGWSVAGLVCGILPTVVLGLIFSVVGLIRTAHPLRRGRAFAVAGLVLSLAWLAGFAALGAYENHQQATAAPAVTVDPTEPVTGDCFLQPPLTGRTSLTTDSRCRAGSRTMRWSCPLSSRTTLTTRATRPSSTRHCRCAGRRS